MPTIFPYHKEKIDRIFSWRSGIFGSDRVRRRLGRLLLGWILILLLEREILQINGMWIAAGLWFLLLLVRTILHRKTLRVLFH